jgi:pimeloyl-ACP methyl ester carboxylesterase
MKTAVFVMTMLLSGIASAQQKPVTGYAPVNGLKMYYEVHGSGEPLVMLHGAFMSISGDWANWVDELSRTRKVIAVEMQGHGRTADIDRDITPQNLADDVAGLLDYLKIPKADILGYSLGGGTAMQCAIRHPDKVRKVVVISYPFRRDGWAKEVSDALSKLTPEVFKGSPMEAEYKRFNPNPAGFATFVKHVVASNSSTWDFGADKLKATTAPMFFVDGDADGLRLETLGEMYTLKGGGMSGDIQQRSGSRVAVIPNTTHVTLMSRMTMIVPMVNDFLDAK